MSTAMKPVSVKVTLVGTTKISLNMQEVPPVSGISYTLPEVGKSYRVVSIEYDLAWNFVTSVVTHVVKESEDTYRIYTKNSAYHVEIMK